MSAFVPINEAAAPLYPWSLKNVLLILYIIQKLLTRYFHLEGQTHAAASLTNALF